MLDRKQSEMLEFAQIRRLEAVSFRSFPATNTHYDGTWAIRLTAGHPAKRLNSVNPLDPQDSLDLENRISKAERRFSSFGRPLTFRLTPLAPPRLADMFEDRGWTRHEESIVMMLDLTQIDLSHARDQVPLKDVGRWVDDFIALSEDRKDLKPGLVEVIGATQPETGLFIHMDPQSNKTASMVRCVSDRTMAGVFDLVSSKDLRQKGHARSILLTALLWAKRHSASKVWLQVVAENKAANALYYSIGFREVYRYCYWKPAGEPDTSETT
jgi:ribosomal protein S18 acetylase RimI-like enzyme